MQLLELNQTEFNGYLVRLTKGLQKIKDITGYETMESLRPFTKPFKEWLETNPDQREQFFEVFEALIRIWAKAKGFVRHVRGQEGLTWGIQQNKQGAKKTLMWARAANSPYIGPENVYHIHINGDDALCFAFGEVNVRDRNLAKKSKIKLDKKGDFVLLDIGSHSKIYG